MSSVPEKREGEFEWHGRVRTLTHRFKTWHEQRTRVCGPQRPLRRLPSSSTIVSLFEALSAVCP